MSAAGAAAGLLTGALVLLPTAAWAQEPERTGWWSAVSAGGVALPQPTTAEGDLRISNGTDGPLAFSAVRYPGAGATAAVLTLAVAVDRTVGTPEVAACVTPDDSWAEGGNQPYDAAPEVDCDAGSVVGELAPDGSTLTFLLDATQQDATGTWNLALVPVPGSPSPFTIDLRAPGAEAFVPAPTSEPGGPVGPAEPQPDGAGPDAGQGEPLLAAGPAVGAADVGLPPLVAGDQAPTSDAAGPAPVAVAAPAPAAVLLARPTGVAAEDDAGRRLLALLVLAGGSAAVGYAAGQPRPGPRLLGGRARLGVPAGAGTAPLPVEARLRGIGRFAKTRDQAPRRLR